jgi:hypothetical protein
MRMMGGSEALAMRTVLRLTIEHVVRTEAMGLAIGFHCWLQAWFPVRGLSLVIKSGSALSLVGSCVALLAYSV